MYPKNIKIPQKLNLMERSMKNKIKGVTKQKKRKYLDSFHLNQKKQKFTPLNPMVFYAGFPHITEKIFQKATFKAGSLSNLWI